MDNKSSNWKILNMNYTTLEESKQLIEAGLDVNTADGYLRRKWEEVTQNHHFQAEYGEKIPCWSFRALLDIIDNSGLIYDISNDKNREFEILVYKADYTNQEVKFHHMEHSIVDMIIWLLENGYIKTESKENNTK